MTKRGNREEVNLTKYWKVTIEFTDAVKAKDYDEARDKACYDVVGRMTDLSDYIEVEECDKQTFLENTRDAE